MGVQTQSMARGIVESLDTDGIVLRLPHTDYRLHLKLTVPAGQVTAAPGKRIAGTIEARALRIHPAAGGGRFLEPITGEPRIVAGTVLAVEKDRRRVLVDAAVPMWLTTEEDQDFAVLEPGGLVNCYVRSGSSFTPAPG